MNEWVLILLVFLLPLVGGVAVYGLPRFLYGSAIAIGSSLFVALYLFFVEKFPLKSDFLWIEGIRLSVLFDRTSGLMIVLVGVVSLCVSLFSLRYMGHEQDVRRYYLKLGFFVSSMIGLLLSGDLIGFFIFWELVGLASFLLIGFWNKKEGVSESAKVSFIVNRFADVSLLAGILLLYHEQGVLSMHHLKESSLLASVLLGIGAFGKSAQFPFSGWLIKAMVGPTPISALIHAATMVTAGVYFLIRMSSVLHEDAFVMITIVGTFTAFYGALCALFQNNIKKILAYSTISQLGYMVLSIGVDAPGASLFHLTTHAFFKSGLFLGSASILYFFYTHTKNEEQDIRFMGGMKKHLPYTFLSFVVCVFALVGMPLFSGFMSKEGILISVWEAANTLGGWHYLPLVFALTTVPMTAMYAGKMILLVFYGKDLSAFRSEGYRERGLFTIPLIVMALFSLWFFYDLNPLAHASKIITLDARASPYTGETLITAISVFSTFLGFLWAYFYFNPKTEREGKQRGIKLSGGMLSLHHGLYLAQFYDRVGVMSVAIAYRIAWIDRRWIDPLIHLTAISAVVLSKMSAFFDRFVVDGVVNRTAKTSAFVGEYLARVSSRDGQKQIIWLLVAIILILGWVLSF